MDFGVSTVFNIIGKVYSFVKAVQKLIADFKDLQKEVKVILEQLSVLRQVVDGIDNYLRSLGEDRVRAYNEMYTALSHLDGIMMDFWNACAECDIDNAIRKLKSFENKDKGFFKKLLRKTKELKNVVDVVVNAEKKASLLHTADRHLKTALAIVQIAFSLTQAKQIQHLEVHQVEDFSFASNTLEVYTNPTGDPPKPVDSVRAEVSKQRLIVSWNWRDEEGEHATGSIKYEVKYHDAKYLIVSSPEKSVALGSQRIKPWHDYAIQVRAVNGAGASPWSFPPYYVRMTEGAPSRPSLQNVKATTRQSVKVITWKPPTEQGVTYVYVEKRTKKQPLDVTWIRERFEFNEHGEYPLMNLDPETEYLVRVRFQNKFDVSESSAEIPFNIDTMLHSQPENLKMKWSDMSTLTTVEFKPPSVNPGTVVEYNLKVTDPKSGTEVYVDKIKSETKEDEIVSYQLKQALDISTYDVSLDAKAKNGGSIGIKTSLFPDWNENTSVAEESKAAMSGILSQLSGVTERSKAALNGILYLHFGGIVDQNKTLITENKIATLISSENITVGKESKTVMSEILSRRGENIVAGKPFEVTASERAEPTVTIIFPDSQ